MTALQREAVGYARAGLTRTEAAEEMGRSKEAVRFLARRAGEKFASERMRNYRARVEAMKPVEAVAYLCDVIDVLTGALSDEMHPVDEHATLTRLERRVLVTLYEARGRAVGYDSLLAATYADRAADEVPEPSNITVIVCRLRKKLADSPLRIKTQPGFGYQLVRD